MIATEPKEIETPDEAFEEDLDGDGVEDVPVGFSGAVVEAPVVEAGLVELLAIVEDKAVAEAEVEVGAEGLAVLVVDAEMLVDDSESRGKPSAPPAAL